MVMPKAKSTNDGSERTPMVEAFIINFVLECGGCERGEVLRRAYGATHASVEEDFKKAGWRMDPNGEPSCPECQKAFKRFLKSQQRRDN